MKVRMMAVVFALGLCSLTGAAQMGAVNSVGPAVGTIVSPAKALDMELGMVEEEMMGAVKAMPADKFGFAPSAAIFIPSQATKFETVRTFGQQAAHVAQANFFFYGAVSGLKPDVDVKAIGSMKSKDEIVAALAASFAFAHKAIATITTGNAFEVIKGADGLNTRVTVATFGVAHAFDHYGQMVEYLRMNGIVPPASAK